MTKDKENTFTIRRGPLDNKERLLNIMPEYIEFENKDIKSDPFTRFEKDDIIACKYGIKWLSGFYFTIGREYQIAVKNRSGKVMNITFKSLYGKNKKNYFIQYTTILEALWDAYFCDITQVYLDKFHRQEVFEIAGVKISSDNITINSTAQLKIKSTDIPWTDLGHKDYHTYLPYTQKAIAKKSIAG